MPYLYIDLYAGIILEKIAVQFSLWISIEIEMLTHGNMPTSRVITMCVVTKNVLSYNTHIVREWDKALSFPKPIVNKINTETYFRTIVENKMERIRRRLNVAAVFPSCAVINSY